MSGIVSGNIHLDLSPGELDNILCFLGYGHISAPVWFVGLEEGLAGMSEEDTIHNLKARAHFNPVMDLREAHLRLMRAGRPIDVELDPPRTQVWQYMAKIMLARSGCKEWKSNRAVKEYIKNNLGRSGGETFLTELSPVPTRRSNDSTWAVEFARLKPGLDDIVAARCIRLKATLEAMVPRPLVICYGFGSEMRFAHLLGEEWVSLGRQIKAAHHGQYLLLPFFGNGQMSHAVIESLMSLGILTNQ